jgi:hypothetical protein
MPKSNFLRMHVNAKQQQSGGLSADSAVCRIPGRAAGRGSYSALIVGPARLPEYKLLLEQGGACW